ncbi:Major sperm protein [Corchorus olitorius]|uniref:Major sperm protein n=1 Tax=Corchorus olitorius TaxID=93759 RepID=A0A1R3IRT3_9ROSI|nr:Major sperm protein [Corchorus olitorius]
MTSGDGNQLISVHPNDLKFNFELEKQSCCDLKVVNKTEHHVAFKVKTTSPKKYFVRPNTGVVQAWDSCVIRVTLQAQKEYPPDMQCRDKFLLQSTIVPTHTDVDDLPADTFNKDSGREIEELKLKVYYVTPSSTQASSEDEGLKSSTQSPDSNSTLRHLKEERDAAVRQTQQLQQELIVVIQRRRADIIIDYKFFCMYTKEQTTAMAYVNSIVFLKQEFMKRRRQRRNDSGFSFTFASLVGLIGLMVGFLLNLSLSSPPTVEGI